jgi:hypothetical protein
MGAVDLEAEDRRLVSHGRRPSGLSNQQPGPPFALTAEDGSLSGEMANAFPNREKAHGAPMELDPKRRCRSMKIMLLQSGRQDRNR